ncbi:hypothetical protein FRB99_003626 [Tulasnella sp. 403]|nr:hypothetical protein FRB99_003626 [Tulasnella sp. 403]
MVAPKKSSAALQVPPTSRTNSSTSSPKMRPKKSSSNLVAGGANATTAPPTVSSDGVPKREPEGREFVDPPRIIGSSPLRQTASKASMVIQSTGKSPKKPKPLARRKRKSSIFGWSLLALVPLVLHAAIVCPYDPTFEDALCSTVHDAHTGLERYALQPLKPYFDSISTQPHVAQALHHASPFVERLAPPIQAFGVRVNRLYLHALSSGQNALHGLAQPYMAQIQEHFNTHINPSLEKHVFPPYKLYIAPALARLERYGRIVGIHAEPHLYRCAVWLLDVGRKAQPYLLVVWGHVAEVPGLVRRHAWEPLMDVRRTYVDPPISKILETVDEAGGDAKPSSATRFEATFMAHAKETPNEQVVLDDHIEAVEDALLETSGPDKIASNDALPGSRADSDAAEEHAWGHEAGHANGGNNAEEDLDAFLRELTEPEDPAEPKAVISEPQHTDNPEEAAERARMKALETAEKRSNIVKRHEEWERKLKELAETHVLALPEILKKIRTAAIASLEDTQHAITMQKDAERALKNTEAFVRKLVSEAGSEDEKVALLENLVGKVKKRFEDGASVVSGNIVTWWENVRTSELEEIEKLVAQVRNMGTTAQADLGLDYAWLDDVTVKDWTRYHDLLDVSKKLHKRLTEMAAGSDKESPVNALSVSLRDLQVELETVVLRFQNHLSEAHEKGLNAIRGRKANVRADSTAEAAPEAVATPTTPAARNDGADPTMSILPIHNGGPDRNTRPDDPDPRYVIMQKDKQQVEDALKLAHEAEVEEAAHASSTQAEGPRVHVDL